MEVHHHAHHDGPKNWKSYLREFGMLFLAVFCGSLAEYQLEHKIEKDRERQFIESMVADMKEDQGKIEGVANYCERQAMAFDSILHLAYTTPLTDRQLRSFYRLQLRYAGNRNTMAFTKRTITQLKNAGGLRLIRNKPASDTITLYDEACETIETQGTYIVNVRMGKINDLSIQLFDYAYFLPAPHAGGAVCRQPCTFKAVIHRPAVAAAVRQCDVPGQVLAPQLRADAALVGKGNSSQNCLFGGKVRVGVGIRSPRTVCYTFPYVTRK